MRGLSTSFAIMLAGMGLFSLAAFSMLDTVLYIYSHNYAINSIIFVAWFFGIGACFANYVKLRREFVWFEKFELGHHPSLEAFRPHLLECFGTLLEVRSLRDLRLSYLQMRGYLCSIEARLEEMRDIPRYLMGVLIFLGLLGTFWGLSKTVGAIASMIGGINVSADNMESIIINLKKGLEEPLGGMGTAFGCSLFGLIGSLLIGFLDLQISRANNRFYHVVERSLSAHVTEGSSSFDTASLSSSGSVSSNGAIFNGVLMDRVIEGMSSIEAHMHQAEEGRVQLTRLLQSLTERLLQINEASSLQQSIVKKIAQSQLDLQEQMKAFTRGTSSDVFEQMKTYLRNLDATTLKLLEDVSEGRQRTINDLRSEIRLVAKTISALAEQEAA